MSERRVALVIGNGNYSRAGLLFNPPNDAEAISATLISLGFEVTTRTDLAFSDMHKTISDFEDSLVVADGGMVRRADAALLFFAGHGLQVKGENYLIPIDADVQLESHLNWQAISLTKIMDVMSSRARASLVFLDACRNNPFTERLARQLALSQDPRQRKSGGDASQSTGPGLAQVKADGNFIAFATAPGRTASDGRDRNSPFTQALVEHLPTPGITVDDMMTRVTASVMEKTRRQKPPQRPSKQSDLDAPFYFGAAPLPGVPPIVAKNEHWADIKDRTDPNVFEDFLVDFPTSPLAKVAARRAEERIAACKDVAQLERLLTDYPQSPRVAAATARLALLLWHPLANSKDVTALDAFIARFPVTPEAALAVKRIDKLTRIKRPPPWKWISGGAAVTLLLAGLWVYGSEDPVARERREAIAQINAERDDTAYRAAVQAGTKAALLVYVKTYPGGRHLSEAQRRIEAFEAREANEARRREVADDAQRKAAEAKARDEQRQREEEAKRKQAMTRLDPKRAAGPLSAAELTYVRGITEGKPGESFKECTNCPQMVVAPPGTFTMGSPDGTAKTIGLDGREKGDVAEAEKQRFANESPPHEVRIKDAFAVGRFAVTFDEWEACVKGGGCKTTPKPDDRGWGRADRPVINVSWNDAQEYVSWLSEKTGAVYRLLFEAEREYVTRAGTKTPFWWGRSITPKQANYDGTYVYEGGGDKGEYRQQTVPVKMFDPNPWGLYQVHGNVWEWVQDCYVGSYKDAPKDGSPAKETSGCSRVLRGGSGGNNPRDLRSANRYGNTAADRDDGIGFRVARTLNP